MGVVSGEMGWRRIVPLVFLGACSSSSAARLKPLKVRAASAPREYLAASSLLCEAFSSGSSLPSLLGRMIGLRYPGVLEANCFFMPAGSPDVGILLDEASDAHIHGVVQLVPARLLRAARSCAQDASSELIIGFVQNLAVRSGHRREGRGTALMSWCDETARARGIAELWLAVRSDDIGTLALHTRCGFVERGEALGNILMAKQLPTYSEQLPTCPESAALTFERASPPAGISLGALGKEVAVQLLYCAVASFGICTLLAPFGGPSLPQLLTGVRPDEPMGGSGALGLAAGDFALGCTVAACWLALRRDEWLARGAAHNTGDATGMAIAVAEAAEGSAQSTLERSVETQLAPMRRIVRDESRLPLVLASLWVWQLSIACAEELYYRGLLQSAVATAGRALARACGTAGVASVWAPELLALALSSAFFGLVHSAWVEEAGAAADASDAAAARRIWFRETASASLIFGVLFAVANHRLLAPIACHALVNTAPLGWSEARRAKVVL